MVSDLSFVGRLIRAWRRHGPWGFSRLMAYNVRMVVTGRYWEHAHLFDDAFDREFNVETRGTEEPDDLSVDEDLKKQGRRYEAVTVHQMSTLIGKLPELECGRFTLVDLGSGKGRALLIAAQYPFNRIVGVEYGRELNDVAVRNIETYRNAAQKCFAVESVCADASMYEFPAEPTLCFMNNPFGEALIERVVERLNASLRQSPRECYVVYLHALHAGVFEKYPEWEQLHAGTIAPRSGYRIWRWKPEA